MYFYTGNNDTPRYERDREAVPSGKRSLPVPSSSTAEWLCKHCLLQRQALRNVAQPPNWPTAVVEVLKTRPGESLDACAIWACMQEADWALVQGVDGAQGRARVLATCLKVCVMSMQTPCKQLYLTHYYLTH